MKAATLILIAVMAASCVAQSTPKPNVSTTDSESLWTGKFVHCDYGFYILLPRGFVAHGSRPPNPIHGFTVALPETGTRQEVSVERPRVIWVNAEYNASDATSTRETVTSYVDSHAADKSDRTVAMRSAKLDTLPATRAVFKYDEGKDVEEVIIAVRGSIVYEIGLRTTAANYESDRKDFERIIMGFHVWRVHSC